MGVVLSVERARELRKIMPAPEARLWNALRELRAKGFHFRRQVQLGSFYADFACHGQKLVIEVDGDTHAETGRYDARRDDLIRNHGYRVLRFTNDEVMTNLEGVMERVVSVLDVPPPSIQPFERSSHGLLAEIAPPERFSRRLEAHKREGSSAGGRGECRGT